MSDYSKIGEGLGHLLKAAAIALYISVPLAIWKAVEIIIWLWKHVDVSIS